MRKLNEILSDIKNAINSIELAKHEIDPRIKGNFEAAAMEAERTIPLLKFEYIQSFRNESEILLISGEGEKNAIEVIEDIGGIVLVNAQEFFENAAKISSQLNPENTISATSYMQLLQDIGALSRASGVRVPKQLEYSAMDTMASLEDNMRNLVRSQFGGAGAEPAWVLLKAASTAVENFMEITPVPVAVYNIKGASKEDYLTLFSSVREMVFDYGTKDEVQKKLKEFANDVRKQGKIKMTIRKTAKTEVQENGPKGE